MQVPAEDTGPRRWLLIAGASAGAALFAIFLLGFLSPMGIGTPIGENWLVILFELNVRPLTFSSSALHSFSALDTGILLLFGILMASMVPILKSTSRFWAFIAAALPFLGVFVFFVTGTAGRSAVLLAGLVSSMLAYRGGFGAPVTAVAGMLASSALLVLGDFATALFPASRAIAVAITAGYVLWTAWLLLTTLELAQLARRAVG
jgi:hypothetical protein